MKVKKLLWLIMAFWTQAVHGGVNSFYASPGGSARGDGTALHPWDLATALGDNTSPRSPNHVVQPGDTIWLRAGTYYGGFDSHLTGSAGHQITVRPYNRERASIESTNYDVTALYVNGNWSTFWGIEIWNSDPNRWVFRKYGLFVNGANTKLIDLIVHDVGVGIYCYEASTNSEIYGGIFYNNGCEYAGGEAMEHSIYVHSGEPGTSIIDNIIGNGFGFGMHCYSDRGEPLSGLRIEGNASFSSGILNTNGGYLRLPNFLVGGTTPVTNLVFNNNFGYYSGGCQDNLQLGYQTYDNYSAVVQNNYFVGGTVTVGHWRNLTLVNNTFADFGTVFHYNPSSVVGSYVWNSNQYCNVQAIWSVNNNINLLFAQWQSTNGFDADSTVTATSPTNAQVFVRTNAYEAGRANIIVYNWGLSNTVSVDVSHVLSPGATYEVRNAQDFFGAVVASGKYDGTPLRLPVTGLTVATPVGFGSAPPSSGPAFNVFVVLTRATLGPASDLHAIN